MEELAYLAAVWPHLNTKPPRAMNTAITIMAIIWMNPKAYMVGGNKDINKECSISSLSFLESGGQEADHTIIDRSRYVEESLLASAIFMVIYNLVPRPSSPPLP